MRQPLLGCIADDFTGASDLANNLSRSGMRVLLTAGIPSAEESLDADAIVIALKTRTAPPARAVALSIEACRLLKQRGVRTIYFKICSTFDSTSEGNIGPVLEALTAELQTGFSVVAPAFPETGRVVRRGHLFVNGVPLSESSMRTHPLTPMTESDLLLLLAAQLRHFPHSAVGLIEEASVSRSAEAIRTRIKQLQEQHCAFAIADTETMDDLTRLAEALQDAALITGSSGLGLCLPRQWGFQPSAESSSLPPAAGRSVILSGSCSEATQGQVQHLLSTGGAGFYLDASALLADRSGTIRRAVEWVQQQWQSHPAESPLVYSTCSAERRLHQQNAPVESMIEQAFAALAAELVRQGVGRLIVAGGETAGVCVQALGIRQLQIGPQIDPGVPWCYAPRSIARDSGLHLTLKSGNFGAVDFFTKAFTLLENTSARETRHE
ncbi:3-oxo-tetronate kinase [Paracidobacterium acidisoli]|uniref:3-oxo-tetronate kinase n=1 Tax=Paracidobacterium acidisoli TaxID=2303751 RepID=A0A372IQR8_9BACT|nr:3-oxo-tetronate kinase [Paracidobacterium acidisoli]MBT9331472.1 four-carbon acid sugar kinase family protein [Paracidobacterium acidisoli]